MLAEEASPEERRVEKGPMRARHQGVVDHREIVREGVEGEVLRPGREEVEREHDPGHPGEEPGMIQERAQACRPQARERGGIAAQERVEAERAIESPGRLAEAL